MVKSFNFVDVAWALVTIQVGWPDTYSILMSNALLTFGGGALYFLPKLTKEQHTRVEEVETGALNMAAQQCERNMA